MQNSRTLLLCNIGMHIGSLQYVLNEKTDPPGRARAKISLAHRELLVTSARMMELLVPFLSIDSNIPERAFALPECRIFDAFAEINAYMQKFLMLVQS